MPRFAYLCIKSTTQFKMFCASSVMSNSGYLEVFCSPRDYCIVKHKLEGKLAVVLQTIVYLSMLSPRGGGDRCGAMTFCEVFFFKLPTLGKKILVKIDQISPHKISAQWFCKFPCYLQYIRFPILQNTDCMIYIHQYCTSSCTGPSSAPPSSRIHSISL